MSDKRTKRRYGSGAVIVHRGAWYGRWWVGDRYVKRKLGGIREPGSREGLTRKQAEMALRRLMTEVRVVQPEERMSFQEAGDRYLHHIEHVKRRKPSTVQDYRIILNKHLVPHFGSKPVDRIAARDVARYLPSKSRGKDKSGGGLSRQDDHQPPQLRAWRVCIRAEARMVHVEPGGSDRPSRGGAGRPRHPLPRPGRARGAAADAPRPGRRRGRG